MPSAFRLSKPQVETARIDQDDGKLPLLKGVRPGKKFTAIHWPDSWSWDDTHGFLPSIRQIIAAPGVNGQKRDKVSGGTDMSPAIANAEKRGATHIRTDDSRLGNEFIDYLIYYPCIGGARWYEWKPAEAQVLPSGRIIWNDDEIEEWKKRFAAHCRDQRIVPPLLPEVYEDLRQKMNKRIDSLAARAGNNPLLKARYDKAVESYNAMCAAWDKSLADEAKAARASDGAKKRVAKRVESAPQEIA